MRYTEDNIDRDGYFYGRYGRNEFFIANILGQIISFDVQPYTHGKGVITAITPRDVTSTREFDVRRGNCSITYEVYDIEVEMIEGSHNGAFWCGVAVSPAKDIAGKTEYLTGVTRGELANAALGDDRKTIVIARCG